MHSFGRLVACCSTAMSVAVLFGGPLLPFLNPPSQMRAGLSWLGNQLSVARRINLSCLDREITPMPLDQRTGPAMATLQPRIGLSDPIGAIISATADNARAYPGRSWSAPIDWLFDNPGSRSILALSDFGNGLRITGFSISGINASNQPLTQVGGILKPDKGSHAIELILSLRGDHLSSGGGRTIPAGAQFSLVYEFPGHSMGMPIDAFFAKFGGAVFTFRYTHAGDHRTLISYLSESTIKEQLLAGGS